MSFFSPVDQLLAASAAQEAPITFASLPAEQKCLLPDISGSTQDVMQNGKRLIDVECATLNALSTTMGGPRRSQARVISWDNLAEVRNNIRGLNPRGGTSPQCVAQSPACLPVIAETKVAFWGTDGQIGSSDVQKFASQMGLYRHLHGAVLCIFLSKSQYHTKPANINVSVMAAFEDIPMLLLVCRDDYDKPGANKVFRATGHFASQLQQQGLAPPSFIEDTTTWDDLPDMDVKQLYLLTVAPPVRLPGDFVDVQGPLAGAQVAFSMEAFRNRLSSQDAQEPEIWFTDEELSVVEAVFPQLLRKAVMTNGYNQLEEDMKLLDRHAFRVGQAVSSIKTPSTVLLDEVYGKMQAEEDKTSVTFKALRESLLSLRRTADEESKVIIQPTRVYVAKIKSLCGAMYRAIAEARAAQNGNFNAGKFYGGQKITNRLAKAVNVEDADDFDPLAIPDREGACTGECQICFERGLLCMWFLPDYKLMTSDILQTFPLAFGHLSKSIVVPGEKPICIDCVSYMKSTPFTRVVGAFFVPLINCSIGANRDYLNKLFSIRLTDGKSLSFTSRAMLAALVYVRECEWARDSPEFRYLITQLLEFPCTGDMSDTGKRVLLKGACRSILEMVESTIEFPLGALYRQPFAAIDVILFLHEHSLGVRHRNHKEILQKATLFTTMTSWLALMHPLATAEQTSRLAQLVMLVMRSLYDYTSTGTAVFNSGRIMSQQDAQEITSVLFGPRAPLEVFDPVQMSVLFGALVCLKSHQALAGAVTLFTRNRTWGPHFALLLKDPHLLSSAEIIATLNSVLFSGCAILDDVPDTPTFVTPYGPSVIYFQSSSLLDKSCCFVRHDGTYTLDGLITALSNGRKEIFRRECHVLDVAPCEGASISNAAMCVYHFYNSLPGDLGLVPKREHVISVLRSLFKIGKGSIHDPMLLKSVVIAMTSYLQVRSTWKLPIINSGQERVTHEQKVWLELELLGIPIPKSKFGTIRVERRTFPTFHKDKVPVTTAHMVQDIISRQVWDTLTLPLTPEELSQVFRRPEKMIL